MGSGRTRPTPQSQYPAWYSAAATLFMSGSIVLMSGLVLRLPAAINAGGVMLVSGLVIGYTASKVWRP